MVLLNLNAENTTIANADSIRKGSSWLKIPSVYSIIPGEDHREYKQKLVLITIFSSERSNKYRLRES